MGKYTAEEVDALASSISMWGDDYSQAVKEILRDYAAHLRERESAKAVARLVVRDGRAAGWEFNAPMPNGTYDLYTAPMLASARAPQIPSMEMLVAARDWSAKKYGKPIGNEDATGCWQAMLAAAPKSEKE